MVGFLGCTHETKVHGPSFSDSCSVAASRAIALLAGDSILCVGRGVSYHISSSRFINELRVDSEVKGRKCRITFFLTPTAASRKVEYVFDDSDLVHVLGRKVIFDVYHNYSIFFLFQNDPLRFEWSSFFGSHAEDLAHYSTYGFRLPCLFGDKAHIDSCATINFKRSLVYFKSAYWRSDTSLWKNSVRDNINIDPRYGDVVANFYLDRLCDSRVYDRLFFLRASRGRRLLGRTSGKTPNDVSYTLDYADSVLKYASYLRSRGVREWTYVPSYPCDSLVR